MTGQPREVPKNYSGGFVTTVLRHGRSHVGLEKHTVRQTVKYFLEPILSFDFNALSQTNLWRIGATRRAEITRWARRHLAADGLCGCMTAAVIAVEFFMTLPAKTVELPANALPSAENRPLPGVRWFVKRSLVLFSVLTLSVAGACALYAAASRAETALPVADQTVDGVGYASSQATRR